MSCSVLNTTQRGGWGGGGKGDRQTDKTEEGAQRERERTRKLHFTRIVV